MEYVVLTYDLMMESCLLNLSIGFFLLIMAMTKVIKQSLYSIGESVKVGQNQTSIMKQLTQFIEYHSRVKQLSK